jgi:hypothetical protein
MSFAKFDRWETIDGANLGTVLQISQNWSGIQQRWTTSQGSGPDYLDSGSENRGRVWWDPEGFTVAIRPKFSTSKILLMGYASVCASTNDSYNIHGRIVRSGTPVGNGILAQGNHTHAAHCEIRMHNAADYAGNQRMHYHFLDTPGVTGVVEYKFQLCHTYSSNYSLYVNRESDLSWTSGTSSHFLAMEIQA